LEKGCAFPPRNKVPSRRTKGVKIGQSSKGTRPSSHPEMGNSGCSRKASFQTFSSGNFTFREVHQPFIRRILMVLKMAVTHVTTSTILSSFLPQFSTSAASFASKTTSLKMRQLALPLLPSLSLSLPAAIQLKIPTLLGDLWESVLRAVPKKKTSYMKKRSRFFAGKALKDVTAINRCSGCGHVKRAHLLCPYCVKGMPYTLIIRLEEHPNNHNYRNAKLV
jgi:large subunit ribosomal protein L32